MWDFFHFLVGLIEREDINIVHSNHPYTNGLISLICSKLTNIPLCVSMRVCLRGDGDLAVKEPGPKVFGSPKLARKVERLVFSQADMITPTNESRARYAIKHGAKPERIRLDPFPLNLSKFPHLPDLTLKQELGIEDKKVISFAGRLVMTNYVNDIIQIAYKVCQRKKDVIFLIVGDGEERKFLEELTHSLGLDMNLKFLGMQHWERAMQIRLISDVSLCLMAGNSLVEAAVAATPLIAYDVDWHYELVRNGETGFLLPEGDIDGVAEAIITLLDNPELAKRLGQNVRKLAVERHSIEKVRQIRINFYGELIHKTRG